MQYVPYAFLNYQIFCILYQIITHFKISKHANKEKKLYSKNNVFSLKYSKKLLNSKTHRH